MYPILPSSRTWSPYLPEIWHIGKGDFELKLCRPAMVFLTHSHRVAFHFIVIIHISLSPTRFQALDYFTQLSFDHFLDFGFLFFLVAPCQALNSSSSASVILLTTKILARWSNLPYIIEYTYSCSFEVIFGTFWGIPGNISRYFRNVLRYNFFDFSLGKVFDFIPYT